MKFYVWLGTVLVIVGLGVWWWFSVLPEYIVAAVVIIFIGMMAGRGTYYDVIDAMLGGTDEPNEKMGRRTGN